MASKIRVLDEQTINKIAAGEVIENPSSVVKELVENAIDAGATDICIEIKGGGRQLIRVTDNGSGMNKDDALLCLERHATSKIRDIDDIHSIYTMGFRGEAVPSIASISKFTLMTSPENDSQGTMVIVDGGKIVQCCPIARSKGTTIEVKSLFFNVPVRKKFQKSPAYDANEILKMLSSIALGHPGIKFELISEQKSVLSTLHPISADFQSRLHQRVEEVLGKEFAASTSPISASEGEYKLEGFVGSPGYTRHNRTGQYLFINKRAVVSPLVSYSVRDGFGSALPSTRHPVYVLHLTMPGTFIDVNVHPQKREVRLRQEIFLKEMIMQAVRNSLQKSLPIPFEPVPLPNVEFTPVFDPPPKKAEFFKTAFSDSLPEIKLPTMPQKAPELFSAKPMARVIGTIRQYILLDSVSLPDQENGDGLCIVDQRAAHSRVIFEKLRRQRSKSEKIPAQLLLIPFTFETTPLEAAALLPHLNELNDIGIAVRQSGRNGFLVDSIPQIFGNMDMRSLITGIVNAMQESEKKNAFQSECEKLVAIVASRSAVSQQRKLSVEEAQALVNQLMQCEMPLHCPQGKPTMVWVGSGELAKRFLK